MSDQDSVVDERLQVLETQLGFQDRTIETLNEVVTKQQDQIDELTLQVEKLMELLRDTEQPSIDGGEEPPPPHY